MPTQAQRDEYYAEGFFVTDDVVEPAMLTKLTDAARHEDIPDPRVREALPLAMHPYYDRWRELQLG
jgi:hypothetical protein